MDLLFTHNTALHYLRSQPDGVSRRTIELPGTAAAVKDTRRPSTHSNLPTIYDITAIPDEVPLHISVTTKSERIHEPGIECHTLSPEHIPPLSFTPVSKGVYTASPELCFVNMANELPFLALVKLGFELCGSYSLGGDAERGFIDRRPLTTASRLAEFATQAQGMHGAKSARKAASYVIDGAASPMETALAMLLCLPHSLGGYGIERPVLNGTVNVPPSLQRTLRARRFKCDLLWPDHHLDVEYDSDRYHTGAERITHDADRRNALKRLGIDVIVVTRERAMNVNRFDETAQIIAKSTGKRLRIRNDSFLQRRGELRRTLFYSVDTTL